MLDMLVSKLDTFDVEWERLASERVPVGAGREFVERLFPEPHGIDVTDRMRQNVTTRRHTVLNLAEGRTNANIAGTKAALVAAATEWNQWYRTKDARRSGLRTLEGTDTTFAHRAWDLAGAL
jgi:hypothetical protein